MSNRRAGQQSQYFLGTLRRVVAVTSSYQRTALMQLAEGIDPLELVSPSVQDELENFLLSLERNGFLNSSHPILMRAKRYLDRSSDGDLSSQHMRIRSAPEQAQSEWIDENRDGGVKALSARSQFPILLSGRSRVITLLYSLLLESGVTRVRFADHHYRPKVEDLDIGVGALEPADLGLAYYEVLEARRRALSLFPLEHGAQIDRLERPGAVIHYGECDPELLVEWSNQQMPHLLIHSPVGDETLIGPLVLPGKSPCLRCLSLYEIDNFGFTRSERLALTTLNELPIVTAHYVAAIAASQILHFIDQVQSDELSSGRNTGVGEVTFINFQQLTEPQVVAIPRHPLCGCNYS